MTVSQRKVRGGRLTALLLVLLLYIAFNTPATTAEEQRDTRSEKNEQESITVHGKEGSRRLEHLDESFYEPFTREKLLGEELIKDVEPDIKSALKVLPNVSVVDSGAFIKRVEIRGLSGDRIVYLVDGLRIANQGLTHAGGGEINLTDISRVESIEVIKGSPSVIYAPGASGGVVSVKTRDITTEDHLGLHYTPSYDDGYEKTKHAINLSGAYGGLGLNATASNSDAKTYKVKNQDKLDQVILRTNVLDERLGTADEIQDLGYNDQSLGLGAKYRINSRHSVDAQHTDYQAEDISFTHGAVTSRVFHYDEYARKSNRAGYRFASPNGHEAGFDIYNQEIRKDIRLAGALDRTLLDSKGVNLQGKMYFDKSILRLGTEYVRDEAQTNTFSEQDYYAAYVNHEQTLSDFTYNLGIRYNRWEVQQNLRPGQNESITQDLVGVSGKLEPQDEDAYTYAAGLSYSVNQANNLSFNYSRTHRYPTLMERFAFDVFVGGGLAIESESADNFEIGWKYNDGLWYGAAALFYSRFNNYIGTKEVRRIIDQTALIECINQGDCDPLTGDFDDRESDFFETKIQYVNFADVVNQGFEFSLKRIVDLDMESGFSLGLNDFDSDDPFATIDSRPLELKAYYKKHLPGLPASPWIKFNARYVTNEPSVEQKEGFSPFFVADLRFGVEYKDVQFNAGIRNLFNEVYHEPFSALDGLERTFFASLSVKIDKYF